MAPAPYRMPLHSRSKPRLIDDEFADNDCKPRLSQLPTAAGSMTRLAYFHAKTAGLALEPLLRASQLTSRDLDDPNFRIAVRSQIKFLNVVADALDDPFLGFHLAQNPDLRQIGLLYYVLASSQTLIDALQRAARYTSIV